MGKLIIISGTPGTGKSTWAKILAKKCRYTHLDLHPYYHQLSTGYNRQKQCYTIDPKHFLHLVQRKKRETIILVVDSHIAHQLPARIVDLCIILTCSNLKELERRLKARKYAAKKIKENIEAEIFQVCLHEAQEKGHKIIIFDTAKKITQKEFVNHVVKNMPKSSSRPRGVFR